MASARGRQKGRKAGGPGKRRWAKKAGRPLRFHSAFREPAMPGLDFPNLNGMAHRIMWRYRFKYGLGTRMIPKPALAEAAHWFLYQYARIAKANAPQQETLLKLAKIFGKYGDEREVLEMFPTKPWAHSFEGRRGLAWLERQDLRQLKAMLAKVGKQTVNPYFLRLDFQTFLEERVFGKVVTDPKLEPAQRNLALSMDRQTTDEGRAFARQWAGQGGDTLVHIVELGGLRALKILQQATQVVDYLLAERHRHG